MPGNQPVPAQSAPCKLVTEAFAALANVGLWDASDAQTEVVRELPVFGGSSEEPSSLAAFRATFREFLKSNEELEGALAEMAIRLFGVEKPYRDLDLKGRLEAVGEVEWQRGKVGYEAVRKRGGRRDEIVDRVAKAIARAERDSQGLSQPAASVQEPPVRVEAGEDGRRRTRRAILLVLSIASLVVAVTSVITVWQPWATANKPTLEGTTLKGGLPYPPASSEKPVSPYSPLDSEMTICKLTSSHSCTNVMQLKRGDTLYVRVRLQNRFNGPLPPVALSAAWESTEGDFKAKIDPLIPSRYEQQFPSDTMIDQPLVEHDAKPRFVYMLGSTRMYVLFQARVGETAAILPDGVMTAHGITIRNYSQTKSCFQCSLTYARLIAFTVTVH